MAELQADDVQWTVLAGVLNQASVVCIETSLPQHLLI